MHIERCKHLPDGGETVVVFGGRYGRNLAEAPVIETLSNISNTRGLYTRINISRYFIEGRISCHVICAVWLTFQRCSAVTVCILSIVLYLFIY